MNVGDIVSVVTAAGEFIGKLDGFDGDSVILEKPRMLVTNGEGMGFARGICMTGKENPDSATFHNVILVTPSMDKIEDAWITATTGIALA
jgi:hypothetical protein